MHREVIDPDGSKRLVEIDEFGVATGREVDVEDTTAENFAPLRPEPASGPTVEEMRLYTADELQDKYDAAIERAENIAELQPDVGAGLVDAPSATPDDNQVPAGGGVFLGSNPAVVTGVVGAGMENVTGHNVDAGVNLHEANAEAAEETGEVAPDEDPSDAGESDPAGTPADSDSDEATEEAPVPSDDAPASDPSEG